MKQHFAQVAVVQQRTPLLGVQTKMRRLSGLRVRRRNARAQTLAKIAGNGLVVRKGILVYVDLPADTAVFRAVRADAPECLVIRRTANVAILITSLVCLIITDTGAVEKGYDGTAFSLVYRLTRSYHS